MGQWNLKTLMVCGFAVVVAAVFRPATAQEPAAPATESPAAQEPEKDKNPFQLDGEWTIVRGTREGSRVEADRLPPVVTFQGKQLTIPAGADPDQKFVIAFKIDQNVQPAAVDFEIVDGPVTGATALGIIRMENGELTLCYDPTGQKRPEAFESTAENGRFLFVLKRRGLDPSALTGTWTYLSGLKAGEELPEERLPGEVTVTAKQFTVPAGPDMAFVMSYTLDGSHQPAHIDMRIESGPGAVGSTAVGIIRLEGDTLEFCYDPAGQKRPESFASSEEDGFFLFRLKRKPERGQ